MNEISIKGAREHNLKNVSLTLPKNKLIVFTGLSGSGKSSLAFDTIYAEGQRRYVESLSSYARQFLGIMGKPDIDTIEGLSPAISIDQKNVSHNPRSTVGTVTEIYDYLRLLFARIGHPHCSSCGREIAQQSAQQIVDSIIYYIKTSLNNRTMKQLRLIVLSPVVRDRKGEFYQLLDNLKARGYQHARIDSQIWDIREEIILIKTNRHSIDAIIDRITITKKQVRDDISLSNLRSRLTDDIEQALSLSDGLVVVSQVNDAEFQFPEKPKKMKDHLYSEQFACPVCNISIPEIEPRTFSFNSPHGACLACTGIGTLMKPVEELVLNPNLSITEGGILPFASMFMHDTWYSRIVKTVCSENGIDIRRPLSKLTKEQKNIILYGTGSRKYYVKGTNRKGRSTTIYESFHGIIAELEKRYHETSSSYVRTEIEKFMREEICNACEGTRLKKESLAITILGRSIIEITRLSIVETQKFIQRIIKTKQKSPQQFSKAEQTIAAPIVKEINARLTFLISVGLGYLTLERRASTLAGGEAQRIRLASQIGSGLSGVLYVLDEPSIGLHQRDNGRLIDTLKKLRDLDNTVIVVEHDREIMEEADIIVDFGPGAGVQGGQVVAMGTPLEIVRNKKSVTGAFLSGRRRIKRKKQNRLRKSQLKIIGCQQFNLKNINVTFPIGSFVCITGVSGSGKSTLVVETLYHALALSQNSYHRSKPGKFSDLIGADKIDKVVLIDQSPIGRTPRSNTATYTGVFTEIRNVFSRVPEARARGYKQGRFSFNVKGGRCEVCRGEGQLKIEMQFLPDVYIDCESCNGNRYNRETLEVHFKGKTIADVLAMSVDEAKSFFHAIPSIYNKLETLASVGLSYIKLGQSAPTLSGGEAQRVKLATYLSKRATGKTVYILDEPTTGLHFADLEKLIAVLEALVDKGNTVIIIEHNLDVIKNADWIIDMGPEGGNDGGEIVAVGTPKDIAKNQHSHTGKYLRAILEKHE